MACFRKVLLFACASFMMSCADSAKKNHDAQSRNFSFLIHDWNAAIKQAMVADGFSPMLASRTFAYPNIAAYEALAKGGSYPSLAGRLNGLKDVPLPDESREYSFELAAVQAFATTAKKLVYSEKECNGLVERHLAFFKDSVLLDDEVMQRSLDYGTAVGEKIIAWASADKYPQTKSQPKYLFSEEPGKWIPTPPEFRSALEPYWGTLRTFSGLKPEENPMPFTIPFSTEKGSAFYQLVFEVYEKSRTISEEEKNIALYWDDNPDQMTYEGHIPIPRRRISPPAHWVGITGEACKAARLSAMETSKCYTMMTIAVADAIICCWKEKYSTDLVRPVTFIREHLEAEWMPFIVTPPFPEHTSGHAAISFASATVLAEFFGDAVEFTDSSLVPFGIKPRSFQSFSQAAQEAADSRFFGGIHYKTGLEGGKQQGIHAARYVINLFEK